MAISGSPFLNVRFKNLGIPDKKIFSQNQAQKDSESTLNLREAEKCVIIISQKMIC